MTPPPDPARVAEIAAALGVFLRPGQVTAVQTFRPRKQSRCCGTVAEAAAAAVEMDGASPQGVYFLPNPVRPDLRGTRTFPKDEDVDRRLWLLIDCDPDRPAGTSSTEAEKAAAWRVLDTCQTTLEAAGFRGAVVADSGNGYHLCFPLDLPNDPESKALVKQLLAGLQERAGDKLSDEDKAALKAHQFLPVPRSHVGAECHDAKRIWACYGTGKRKGTATAERPHRRTWLVEGVPWDEATARGNNTALTRQLELWSYAERVRKGRPETDDRSYALAALRQECEAVAATPAGTGLNDRLSRSAYAVGGYLRPDVLEEEEAFAQLYAACLTAGGNDPEKDQGTIRRQLREGTRHPRQLPSERNGHHPGSNGTTAAPPVAASPEPWEPPIPLDDSTPAEPFPLDVLPPPLRAFVEEVAWAVHCPPDFPAVSLLAVAGGAVGNSCRLSITRSHTQGAVLFAVIVGSPASGKSPALELVAEPLEAAQQKYADEHAARLVADPDSTEPLRRCLVDDVTTEALVGLLRDSPRGLTMVRDELAALVSGLNQYRDGGKGSDRQIYLKLWPQSSVKVDRVRTGGVPVRVRRPFVAIVGGIQPQVIEAMRGEAEHGRPVADDGFLDRFLLSYPAELPAAEEYWREVSEASEAVWKAAVERLLALEMVEERDKPLRPHLLHLTPCGRLAWVLFTREHAAELNAEDFPRHLRGAWGKLRGYCGRLALVLHLLWDAGPAVNKETVGRAARLVAYFKQHVRKVYQAIGADSRIEDARRVLRWVRGWGKPTFTRRDLWRGVRKSFNRPEDLVDPLKLLQHCGYVRWAELPKGANGRPQTTSFEVHPSLSGPGDLGDTGDKTQ